MRFFSQMKESVIDINFYRSIKDNKFSKSFTYLLPLYLIIYIMYSTIIFISIQGWVSGLTYQLTSNVPDFKLSNGEFSFQGKMPYTINNTAGELIVFDTTGKTTEKVLDKATVGMFIAKDYMVIKQPNKENRFSFTELKGTTITKNDFVEFLPKLNYIIIVGIILYFVIALGIKLANVLLLALCGLLFNEALKTDLKFGSLVNFSIYALTLPLLLELAVFLSGMYIPYFTFIYWFISIAYVAAAIKNYKNDMLKDKKEGGDAYLA